MRWIFDAVGIASFGPLELRFSAPSFGRLLETPKPGWAGTDLVGQFCAPFDLPVVIETDVNAAALAEGMWVRAAG